MAKKKNEAPKPIIKENIAPITLDDLMGDRFGQYAKEVIQDRAIPDARDGLKPVQRRIIYDMWNTGNTIEKPTKKCAHIVGDVMGKYHPHGDSSIYEALVNMSKKWAYRMPLIDFQGNNGSIDGDGPAAYRYTEARLSALSGELIRDIDKDSVDMELTFDDTEWEPTVLPARFPNLLVNGSEGIAVGISTNIPPHNLGEVVKTIVYRIKHPDCSIEDLLKYLPGPDFPTGGIIFSGDSLKDVYLKGAGKIKNGSKCECTEAEDGTKQIIITEIPYRVNKSDLVKEIDRIRHDKIIPGIVEVRDESDKHGLRIAIDLRNDVNSEAILKYLLNKTKMVVSYSAHMVAIIDDRPYVMNLADYCDCYIQHQLEVVSRRTTFVLAKDKARLSIVDGLIKAVSILDDVIHTIRHSEDKADAKRNLIANFNFGIDQAEAILNMPLYKLSHTDMTTLEEEKKSLENEIAELNSILSSQEKREDTIIKDLNDIVKKYGDKRKTEIREETSVAAIDQRSLIIPEDVRVVVTRECYIKRSSIKSWKSSGGHKGDKAGIKEGDSFVFNAQVQTIDHLVCFTNKGNYLLLAVNQIKDGKWLDEGFHVNSLVSVSPGERIVNAFVVTDDGFRDDLTVIFATAKGLIKRVALSSLPTARRSKPISAIKLNNDEVIGVALGSGNSDLFVASVDGQAVFYNENAVAITNPKTGGMKIGSFKGKEIAGILSFSPDEKDRKILFITDRGHTRVFDLKNIEKTGRIAKTTTIFSCFQKEPHKLVFIDKASGKEAPYTYNTVIHGDQMKEVTFHDFYLTPMEKYAKRPETFPARDRILFVSNEASLIVNKDTPHFDAEVSDAAVKPTIDKSARNEESSNEEYEQIDLFGDELAGKKR